MNTKISIVIPTRKRNEKLVRLLDSLYASDFNNFEIIIVNDDIEELHTAQFKYKNIVILNNKSNRGLAYSRNRGARMSKSEYILFVDDDNVVEKDMLGLLYDGIQKNKDLAAIGPMTYFYSSPNKLWFLGGGFNIATTRAYFYTEIEKKRMVGSILFRTENLHNCFMIRKDLGDTVGWFDEKLFMGGTEFDLFMRIKKINKKYFLATHIKAKCYHDTAEKGSDTMRNLGLENTRRLYYFQRNRGVFVRRYGSARNKFMLTFISYPVFFIFYSYVVLSNKRFNFFIANVRGVLAGYYYLLFKKL